MDLLTREIQPLAGWLFPRQLSLKDSHTAAQIVAITVRVIVFLFFCSPAISQYATRVKGKVAHSVCFLALLALDLVCLASA
jgi:hypothetical protein